MKVLCVIQEEVLKKNNQTFFLNEDLQHLLTEKKGILLNTIPIVDYIKKMIKDCIEETVANHTYVRNNFNAVTEFGKKALTKRFMISSDCKKY